MAVDSRDKRSSCVGVMSPVPQLAPNPDNDISSEADRTHIAWSYSGLAAVVPGTYYHPHHPRTAIEVTP
jgi:hypothetical protein